MIASFITYLKHEKRYSENTLTAYQTDLNQFEQYILESFECDDLRRAEYSEIRSWIIQQIEDGISPRSVNRKIATLKSYFKFLLLKGEVDINPTLKLRSPKTKKSLPVFVEESKMHQLLDQIDFTNNFEGQRDKLILEFLYGTGIRLSELINLEIDDISMSSNVIKVLGKGNKERIIPVNNSLKSLISSYLSFKDNEIRCTSNYLFLTDKGEQCYPMLIYRVVKKYLNLVSSLEKSSPHILRHSFATHLLNKGADLNAIKSLLGHSSLAATQVYTHNSTEKLKGIFDQAHPKA